MGPSKLSTASVCALLCHNARDGSSVFGRYHVVADPGIYNPVGPLDVDDILALSIRRCSPIYTDPDGCPHDIIWIRKLGRSEYALPIGHHAIFNAVNWVLTFPVPFTTFAAFTRIDVWFAIA